MGFEVSRIYQKTSTLRGRESGLISKASRHMDVPGRAVREDAFCVFVFNPLSLTMPPDLSGNLPILSKTLSLTLPPDLSGNLPILSKTLSLTLPPDLSGNLPILSKTLSLTLPPDLSGNLPILSKTLSLTLPPAPVNILLLNAPSWCAMCKKGALNASFYDLIPALITKAIFYFLIA